jgi:hypothetical protein
VDLISVPCDVFVVSIVVVAKGVVVKSLKSFIPHLKPAVNLKV